MCLQAEMEYTHAGMAIEARFVLYLIGKRDADQIHILTGMERRHLSGHHISYSALTGRTAVLVRCSNVRDFLAQMNTSPENFVEETWIEEILNCLQRTSPMRLGTAGSC